MNALTVKDVRTVHQLMLGRGFTIVEAPLALDGRWINIHAEKRPSRLAV